MKSHYKKIGDYIQLVDERNAGLKVKTLLGLSISKQFIPSVANIIGTDMENYKIIRKNHFACSTMQVRRDRKMPVALLQDFDEAIISPAYPVFEVADSKTLLPEYLMMWFSRSEFDREALFYAIGGVRGSLEWEDFCNMTLPIPSPDKQREIIKEYNTILNRIDLNNGLIQKLEETAQTIYKQWFVDFEFPNENGEPYKSAGGEMEFNSDIEKEIPLKWTVSNIGEIAHVIDCLHTKKPENVNNPTGNIMLQVNNILDNGLLDLTEMYWVGNTDYKIWTSRIEVTEGDCVITNVGKDAVARIPKGVKAAMGRNMTGIRLKKGFPYPSFLIQLLVSNSMKTEIELKKDTGTILEALNVKNIPRLKFIKAPTSIVIIFEKIISPFRSEMERRQKQSIYLYQLREILLSKLATINS